ncbi:MAG TPA: cyclic nucleotide-binding domain-containing protein [Actinomycetota bacterium]
MAETETDAARVRALKAVPLFAGLPEDSLRSILDHATEFEVPAGQVLVEANHPGAGLFVIEEGTVSVGAGPKKIELGPGEFFGELALLTTEATHATRVAAHTPVKALAIARADFQTLLTSEPKIALAMLSVVAERLHSAMHQ